MAVEKGATPQAQVQERYPYLFTNDRLERRPETVVDVLAASQFLRASDTYKVDIKENKIEFSNGETRYILEAGQGYSENGNVTWLNSLPIIWATTLESAPTADGSERKIIEPTVIAPPDIDNMIFRITWESENDLVAIGVMDGKGGEKKPVSGTEARVGGQAGRGKKTDNMNPGAGILHIFFYEGNSDDAQGFSVKAETITGEKGATVFLALDAPENLTRGGFDFILIPGKEQPSSYIKVPLTSFSLFSHDNTSAPPVTYGDPLRESSILSKTLNISTRAANVGGGRGMGEAERVKFVPKPEDATAVKFRVRVRTDIPPLEGTNAYAAWLRSLKEEGDLYKGIICTYCGQQALDKVAKLDGDQMVIHEDCSNCGGAHFQPVEYLTQRKSQ